jgi:predicted nucleotidyltransferase
MDRDFLQTNEGFFFCVIGVLHPPDRIISYIKYIPSDSSIWGRGEKRFSRILKNYTIPNLLDTFKYLEGKHPHYMYHSPVDNITLTAVPTRYILNHFKPEKKLAQLQKISKPDSLQQRLLRLTSFLEEISGVPGKYFGVTGSLLLDIHQPKFSDLDIIVYGVNNSWLLQKSLSENLDCEIPMNRLKGIALKEWCKKKAEKHPLSLTEASKIYERKWNLGLFENKWVSIHPVKLKSDISREYGELIYYPCGHVTIQAIIHDNTDSLFLPSLYKIKEVKVLEGPQFGNITELVAYESLYDSIANKGESIQARGKLERVTENGKNVEHYRVLVGSVEGEGTEYIKLMD